VAAYYVVSEMLTNATKHEVPTPTGLSTAIVPPKATVDPRNLILSNQPVIPGRLTAVPRAND
jgi:hypothetical protein